MLRKPLGIVIFDEVEVLDFCDPFEVFSVTRLNAERRQEDPSSFTVLLVSQFKRPAITTGGMKVIPDVTFADCPALDMLVVPGGWGTRKERDNDTLLSFVRSRAPQVETLASVCTGALILGRAGLLDGLCATTHGRALPLLPALFPKVTVDSTARVVRVGNVVTSAGLSAGIDLALSIIAAYFGEGIARATARHMEYPCPETYERRMALEPGSA